MDSGSATLIAAAVAAAVAFIVLTVNLRQNRKLETIHVLVNNRMDLALAQIEQLKLESVLLKRELAALKEELARLKAMR